MKTFHPREFQKTLNRQKKVVEIDIEAILKGNQEFPIKRKADVFREIKENQFENWKNREVEKSAQELRKDYNKKLEALDISV